MKEKSARNNARNLEKTQESNDILENGTVTLVLLGNYDRRTGNVIRKFTLPVRMISLQDSFWQKAMIKF